MKESDMKVILLEEDLREEHAGTQSERVTYSMLTDEAQRIVRQLGEATYCRLIEGNIEPVVTVRSPFRLAEGEGERRLTLHEKVTLADLRELATRKPEARVVWSTRSCWWCVWDLTPTPYAAEGGIPTDPFGAVLLECHDLAGFLDRAEADPDHYGKHGLTALMASYHGNLTTSDGEPVAFTGWIGYNLAIARLRGLT